MRYGRFSYLRFARRAKSKARGRLMSLVKTLALGFVR